MSDNTTDTPDNNAASAVGGTESKSGMQHYDKVRKLGQGSFGSVFLMRDRRDNMMCVMKAIDLDQLDAKGKQDALREVGFLATLKHPAIIAYRDYFQVQEPAIGWRKAQNMLHIIMEFADGGDLSGRIRTQNNVMFPEHQVMLWLVQVCLALKHMHDRNVIHRDIKSENVFLTSTNIVKLGDFGISKHLANTLANAHTRIGTPYYLSPEICMDRPYNNKTDMWALGVVLYEMLMLCHPFDASSMEQLLAKICRGRHQPVSRRWNPHLRAIVDKLLSKDPQERPSVDQLLKNQLLQPYIKKFLDSLEPQTAAKVYESLMYVHGQRRNANNSQPSPARPTMPSTSSSVSSSQHKSQPHKSQPHKSQPQKASRPSYQPSSIPRRSDNKANNGGHIGGGVAAPNPSRAARQNGGRLASGKQARRRPGHASRYQPHQKRNPQKAGREILGRMNSPPRRPNAVVSPPRSYQGAYNPYANKAAQPKSVHAPRVGLSVPSRPNLAQRPGVGVSVSAGREKGGGGWGVGRRW